MNKTTPKQAMSMLKKWKELLGLQHWVVELRIAEAADLGPLQSHLVGSAQSSYKNLMCIMHVALHRSPEEVDCTILHELLHMMITPLETVAVIGMGSMGKQAQGVLKEFLEQQCEILTIQLERAIVRIVEKEKV